MAKKKSKPIESTIVNNENKRLVRKKRRRRFRRWLSFIIVLGAAGYGFWVGWTQIEIEQNQLAVLYSKTSSYSEVLEPGKFHWFWQRLLPTNSQLYIYDADARNSRLSFEAELPSSDVYASAINETSDIFSYSLRIDISYMLNKEYLIELLKLDRVTPDEMVSWYVTKEEQIRQKMNNWVTEVNPETLQDSFNSDGLIEYLNRRFPSITVLSASLIKMDQPDYELYNIAKELYMENINFNNEIKQRLAEENIIDNSTLEGRIDAMNRYGEVLAKYPELIEFFAIDVKTLDLLIDNE